MMKFGVIAILACVFCSCVKEQVEPWNNLKGTWNWISTTQDSTFYEDTASSSNTQFLNVSDYKNMEWKRNDTVFYSGLYTTLKKVSTVTGSQELILKMNGIQQELILNRHQDTLWLQENINSGRIYKFVKN